MGKSVLFNALTGSYAAVVSNYPGTTVEVSRGTSKIGAREFEIIDTPGMYSLLCLTEEENVARAILLDEAPAIVVHVIDAKNLERHLSFTLQLLESGLSVILVLNVMDEARLLNIKIDSNKLEKELGIPVVEAVSTKGEGLDILRGKIEEYARKIP